MEGLLGGLIPGAAGVEERYLIRTAEGHHSKPAHSIAASHALDRDFLVTGSVDRKVRFLDCSSGEEVAVCLGHKRSVMAVAISAMGPDGEDPLICSGGRDGSIIVWDPDDEFSGKMVRIPLEEIRCIAVYQGSETFILVGSKEGKLVLWDLTNDIVVATFEGSKGCIHCCSICSLVTDPESQNDLEHLCIASGGADRCVRLWDMFDPNNKKRKLKHNRSVGCMAIAGKGFRPVLASGASDNIITIWDITSGLQLQVLEGHLGPVNQICVWEGFEILVISASADRTVRVFDALTSECVCTLIGHEDDVLDLVVTSETQPAVASCSLDNTIKFWDLDQIIKDFYKTTGEDIGSRNSRPAWNPSVDYTAPKNRAEMVAAQEERAKHFKEQKQKRKEAKKQRKAASADQDDDDDDDEDDDDGDFFAAPVSQPTPVAAAVGNTSAPPPSLGSTGRRASKLGMLVDDTNAKMVEIIPAESAVSAEQAANGYGNKVAPEGGTDGAASANGTKLSFNMAVAVVSAVRRMSTKITFQNRFSHHHSIHPDPDSGASQGPAMGGGPPTGLSRRGSAARKSVMYRKADELQLQFAKAEKSKEVAIDKQKSAAQQKLADRLNKRKGIESTGDASKPQEEEEEVDAEEAEMLAVKQEKLLQHKLQEARMRKAMLESQMRSANALQKRLDEIAAKRALTQVISDDEDSDSDLKPVSIPAPVANPSNSIPAATTTIITAEIPSAPIEIPGVTKDIFYLSDDDDD